MLGRRTTKWLLLRVMRCVPLCPSHVPLSPRTHARTLIHTRARSYTHARARAHTHLCTMYVPQVSTFIGNREVNSVQANYVEAINETPSPSTIPDPTRTIKVQPLVSPTHLSCQVKPQHAAHVKLFALVLLSHVLPAWFACCTLSE